MKGALIAVLFFCAAANVIAVSFDEGKAAFGRQDWNSASVLLGRFLQESPDDPQAATAAFLRAVALYQMGDFRASLDGFQKLDRAWPQSAFVKRLPYWKGTAALAAGQWALAERELAAQAQFSDQEPYTTRALLNLALARIAQSEDATAVQALDAFAKASREPDLLAQAWAVWGDQDRKASRTAQALNHYKASWTANPGDRWDLWSRTQAVDLLVSLGRFGEAKTLLEASAKSFPAEADRWDLRRVNVFRNQGDRTTVAQALEALWGRETDARRKQDLAANRARTAEELGKPDAGWWLKASQGPDTALGVAAILRYAFLIETGGRWADAAQALESWSGTHSDAPVREQAFSRAADDRLRAGDTAAARKDWDLLTTSFPASPQMPKWLLARGRAFLDGGDTTRALVDFSRVVREYPKSAESLEARYQTGLVYLRRQEPARAESWFFGLVQELKTGDLYERALLARGVSFVNSGQTDLARGSLQRLLREDPHGPWAGASWAALGRNALQVRLFDEASEAFNQAETALSEPAEKAKALWSLAESRSGQGETDAASDAYRRYSESYADQPRAAEARYRQGAVYFTSKDWQKALEIWNGVVVPMRGDILAETREGMATALLHLGRIQEGWDQLQLLESAVPSPEAWYRWGQAATALGESDWAVKAFQVLLEKHPTSPAAEAALPRAAGTLLNVGKPEEALARYADYFKKYGGQPSSAPVARAATAAALPFPKILEAMVTASRGWNLAPEVAAEFALAWAQSRLDSDTDKAQAELQDLSRSAPWTSQRSEALLLLGRWNLSRGRLAEARTALEAASELGDDFSVFKARWALAQVADKDADRAAGARARETAEKSAGPGVPLEFRLQILKEAADAWTLAGQPDDAKRVQARIVALGS